MFKEWEICDVLFVGMTYEIRATLESMCYDGICYLSADDL